MESSTSRTAARQLKQDDLKRKIALLQAQLEPESDLESDNDDGVKSNPNSKPPGPKHGSPSRREGATLLAPATPSPRKKRRLDAAPLTGFGSISGSGPSYNTGSLSSRSSSHPHISGKGKPPGSAALHTKPPPSTFLTGLAALKAKGPAGGDDEDGEEERVRRTTGFGERASTPPAVEKQSDMSMGTGNAPRRDDRLALIQDLEPGPYDHAPLVGDPAFDTLEPHSGISLSSRKIAHTEFSDYLLGRFFLSPAQLYALVKLLPDGQGYDVPVPGDWVTVAVVAERGGIRYTKAPVAMEGDEKKGKWGKKDGAKKGGEGEEGDGKRSGGKKFVTLKLIDFGARSDSVSGGKRAAVRGDAFLNLMLFEADSFGLVPREDGGVDGRKRRPEKVYRGGSGGAFERMMEVKEGDVVAVMNPRILKPFQRTTASPHPQTNILAITPSSASSILVLGTARDLGMCTVRKQDGKVCGAWVDRRMSGGGGDKKSGDVCEWHVESAVKRRRAGRAEFSAGTGGMSNTSTHRRKDAYDPARKWGLQPSSTSSSHPSQSSSLSSGPIGATYVISGHIIPSSSSDPRTMYVSEGLGREAQARARRAGKGGEDRALKVLLERDREGMRSVVEARRGAGVGGDEKKKGKGKTEGKGKKRAREEDENEENEEEEGRKKTTSYSAEFVKALGFDPSSKGMKSRGGAGDKLIALEEVLTKRKGIALGPRPGPKIRSGVVAPTRATTTTEGEAERESDHDLDGGGKGDEKMVDLDDF